MIVFIHETFEDNDAKITILMLFFFRCCYCYFRVLDWLFLFRLFWLLLLLLLRLLNWGAKFDTGMLSFPDSWRHFQLPYRAASHSNDVVVFLLFSLDLC